MAIEGSLDLFRLPEILQVISQENKTGILTVQGERDIIAISFSNGSVVAADALNQTLEEALGETLDRENLLARSEYEAAVAEQRSSGGRLIDVLVDRGYLDRSELLTGLRRHTSDLLSDVLVWDEGDFKFYTNDEVSYEEGFEPISVESLLLANLGDAEPVDPEPLREEPPPETPPTTEPPTAETPAAPAETAAPARKEPQATPSRAEPSRPIWEEPAVRAPAQPTATTASAGTASAPARAPVRPAVSQPRVRRRAQAAPSRDAAPAWIPRLLGAVAAVAAALAFYALPSSGVLVPLPGTDPARAVLEQTYRNAWVDHVGDAIRTFHLLEGRLPENLDLLVDRGLLTTDALETDVGTWEYEPGPDAFRLSLDGTTLERSIRGDFLHDPDFLLGSGRLREPPLVLLD